MRKKLAPGAWLVLVILVIWLGIAVLASRGVVVLSPPPQWFDAWSKLVAGVVATVVGARVLWVVPKQLDEFLSSIADLRRGGGGHAAEPIPD